MVRSLSKYDLKVCKICEREYPHWAHTQTHPDLCVECGNRSQRFLKALYILSHGKEGVQISMMEVPKFLDGKTDNQLDEMVKEIKLAKYK